MVLNQRKKNRLKSYISVKTVSKCLSLSWGLSKV